MLIEIHMLKNYPASNLNRDDTGAPKTNSFGGVQRGRISSQCLKHTLRQDEQFQLLESCGYRSRKLPSQVANMLTELPDEARKYVEKVLIKIGEKAKGSEGKKNKADNQEEETDEPKTNSSAKKKDGVTQTALFYSPAEVRAIADIFRDHWEKCKGNLETFQKLKTKDVQGMLKKASARAITMDIALFGRMVTSDAFVNVEAAMQVAHAVSTHAVNLESDYFTTVDDLIKSADEAKTAMLGDIDFNSCCYYEYASLDTDKLRENLKDSPETLEKLDDLLPALLRAMTFSNPKGKQNSFAAHVLPDLIMVEFKNQKIPLNYANAFARPVSRYSQQIVQDSIQKLADEVDLADGCYEIPVVHRAWLALRSDAQPKACERFTRFAALVDACAQWAKE